MPRQRFSGRLPVCHGKGQEGETEIGREKEQHGAVWVATAIQFAWQHPLWVLDETAAARSWDTLVAYLPPSPALALVARAPPTVACRVQDGLLPVYLPSAFN